MVEGPPVALTFRLPEVASPAETDAPGRSRYERAFWSDFVRPWPGPRDGRDPTATIGTWRTCAALGVPPMLVESEPIFLEELVSAEGKWVTFWWWLGEPLEVDTRGSILGEWWISVPSVPDRLVWGRARVSPDFFPSETLMGWLWFSLKFGPPGNSLKATGPPAEVAPAWIDFDFVRGSFSPMRATPEAVLALPVCVPALPVVESTEEVCVPPKIVLVLVFPEAFPEEPPPLAPPAPPRGSFFSRLFWFLFCDFFFLFSAAYTFWDCGNTSPVPFSYQCSVW